MLYAKSTGGFYLPEIHGDAIPADAVEITGELHAELLDGQAMGKVITADAAGHPILVAREDTIELRAGALLSAVEKRLNDAARAKGYDSIVTAALRAGYPGPFHDEGVTFATWMDETYAGCYQLLAQVKAGDIPEPNEGELLAMLPEPPSLS